VVHTPPTPSAPPPTAPPPDSGHSSGAPLMAPPPPLLLLASALLLVRRGSGSAPCASVRVPGYSCYRGFCAADGAHGAGKRCGPELQELKLGGSSLQQRADLALAWCHAHPACAGFALDPDSLVTLAYKTANFTRAAVHNSDWTAWWRGPPQPTPPPAPPGPPGPKPTPPWDPPVPPTPDPPWVRCTDDGGCNLNGVCARATGRCVCDRGWRGENCELMALAPPARGQGTCDPSLNGTATGWTTTWGGRPIQDSVSGDWHYHIAEMANHCGMCRWASVSQVAHYVSRAPKGRYATRAGVAHVAGPYRRIDTSVGVFAHNPIVAEVPNAPAGSPSKFIMLHIGSGATAVDNEAVAPVCSDGTTPLGSLAGDDAAGRAAIPRAKGRMHIASSLDGPWAPAPSNWTVPSCNNPHPLFLPDGRLMIACDGGKCNLGFRTSLTPNWRTGGWSDEVCVNATDDKYEFNGTSFGPANEECAPSLTHSALLYVAASRFTDLASI
jgi:hypothetical protein